MYFADPHIQLSAQQIITLEEDTVSLHCIPTPEYLEIHWTFNGAAIFSNEVIMFTPPTVNHTLTINNASVLNGGVYSCQLVRSIFQLSAYELSLRVLQGTVQDKYSNYVFYSEFNCNISRHCH